MGFLSILRKTRLREKGIRLLMLGLDNAGKTTVVKKFNDESIEGISPTLGFKIVTLQFRGFQLNIWDVGGQKTLRSFWRNYFEQTDGLIWVVDSADTFRMQTCCDELHKLLLEERLAGASLLIFANKQDLSGAESIESIKKMLNLEEMSSSRHWRIQECSAFTGEGLVEGIDWLVKNVASRIFLLD